MNSPSSAPWKRLTALAVTCAGAAWLAYAGVKHEIAHHYASSSNPDDWVRAAAIEPANADIWYALGRYRQLDFDHLDLPAAISYYQRAVQADPNSPFYKLDLASTLELTGDAAGAEKYFRAAQANFPISAEVAWRYGNFLLRQNRLPEAFAEIHRALMVDPRLLPVAISVCWHGDPDVRALLDQVLPGTTAADWEAISFLVQQSDADAAMTVWKQLVKQKPDMDSTKLNKLIDLLIMKERFSDAGAVWSQANGTEQASSGTAVNRSLVFDGGFESDLSGGGFGWRNKEIADAGFDFDTETKHGGARSASITFDGKENLDYAGLSQFVLVEPNTRYRFQGFLQTAGITTDSGMRFEIRDPLRTPVLDMLTTNETGDQPWTLEEVAFKTGPQTQMIEIVLRRLPSQRLHNGLGGTVWVDDVSLVPLGSQE
jgi:tetratricopeptide (TPR) repeat protein